MDDSPHIVVTLELVSGAVPIAGRLSCAGDTVEFDGWLELARVLQIAHDREAAALEALAAASRRAQLARRTRAASRSPAGDPGHG
jgi:hypothetical protein